MHNLQQSTYNQYPLRDGAAHQLAHMRHHDPWAHNAMCCDQDHGGSSSTSSSTQQQYHPLGRLQTPAHHHDDLATCTADCPMETYCCDGDYCTGHHAGCDESDECCTDPKCDESGDVCDHDHGECNGHDESHGHHEGGGVKSLEEWADSKEGCHALQQLLECCNQPDCGIPVCPTENAAVHPPPPDPLAALFASMTAQSVAPAPVAVDENTTQMEFASHTCHWGNCHLVFKSMPDLLAHVAADHLSAWGVGQRSAQDNDAIQAMMTPPAPQSTPQSGSGLPTPTIPQGFNGNMMVHPTPPQVTMSEQDRLLSCLWDDCFPITEMPTVVPEASNTNTTNMVYHDHHHLHSHDHSTAAGEPYSPGTLLRHVLEEHLGVPGEIIGWPEPSVSGIQQQQQLEKYHHHHHVDPHHLGHHYHDHDHNQPHPHAPPHHHHPLPTPPSTVHTERSTSPAPSLTRQHICHWPGCSIDTPFPDTASLMDHLSEVHIPRGQESYACHWEGCRGEGRTFKSRQKVLRHLQSHVAHKPFVCGLCDQAFSEAAPLSAHMRRHAQEKPFKCEHPGCGKSFAISSSLTIHMRTHNGEKPFVCPYCQKGFIEASNLTKHIRTHTGERPFACAHPGCGKRFTRPDQLKRHMKVHDKPHSSYGKPTQTKVVV
ncbi:hypothetical protein CI109_100806 [Kwoniella shandongensis]|uniref:Uncharacterized protein n=1 Tax=Kwoniella shandongensis TaxID=1734106 RepID=A0A5M6BYV9_9TREE|nr:uncharacterized protein CI109_005015 [Kwoniella shandongensis]KAA5526625.1 hypothetical protein CI109_005015 [Kwoniella shandongensis]